VVTNNPVRLTIAKVGPFTEQVHKLKVGDSMTFRGPYGSPFTVRGKHPLLVGGGYGVAPLYLLAQVFSASVRKNITVVIGAKTKSDLAFITKFKALGCRVLVATDDGTAGKKGFSTDIVGSLLKKIKLDSIYTCGPEIMMKKVAAMAKDGHIFCEVSVERHFKCGGMGLCGSCHIGGLLACVDGPVFPGSILL
jgi:dihydroorotate dehydrogenase electron transfer subunit